MVYLWTEDTNAGLHFWKLFNEYCFNGKLCVETKYSNEGVVQALEDLNYNGFPVHNCYIIAFDCSFDNVDIYNKFLKIHAIKSKYPDNIFLLNLICFEQLILEFEQLQDWTGGHKSELFNIRTFLLNSIHGFRIDRNRIDDVATLDYLSNFKKTRSTEFIIKAITRDLTSTDSWRIDSEFLGECWWKDCCIEHSDYVLCGKPPIAAKLKLNILFNSVAIKRIERTINIAGKINLTCANQDSTSDSPKPLILD